MTTREQVDLLWDRFVHQTASFARQKRVRHDDGTEQWQFRRYFEGRCTHTPRCPKKSCPDVFAPPLERRHLAAHLAGEMTVGVYQLCENTVTWVCFDVDISKGTEVTDETWKQVRIQTRRLARHVYEFGIPFIVEFSGNRGMHLWVFFATPVQAADAYAFGHFILQGVEVIDGLHIELYPKQPHTQNLGNLVKLPLGVHRKSGKRTMFVKPSFEPYEDQWAALARTRKMTADELAAFIAEHNVETDVLTNWKVRDTDYGRGLPCFTNIMKQGISEGSRDEVTFRLAVFLKNHGLPMDVTRGAILEWNDKNDPPLSEYEVEEKIESAYNRDYSHFACLRPEFEPFCDPNCMFYENRVKSLKKLRGKGARE